MHGNVEGPGEGGGAGPRVSGSDYGSLPACGHGRSGVHVCPSGSAPEVSAGSLLCHFEARLPGVSVAALAPKLSLRASTAATDARCLLPAGQAASV